MSDLARASPAPSSSAQQEANHAVFGAALAAAVDRALCDLTVDPPAGQSRDDFDAAWARIDRAFAPCRAAFRNHPWALGEIQALLHRLRDGLASACIARHLEPVAAGHLA